MATESDEIKRARQDVTNAAAEHDRALQAAAATGIKLQAAQERLKKLLAAAEQARK